MAGTLNLNFQLTANNGGLQLAVAPVLAITLAGNDLQGNVQNIGIASEQIVMTDIGTAGYAFFRNLDTTNFVSISIVNPAVAGTSFAKLRPGEWCFVPTAILAFYAIADTAPVDLQIIYLELT